ncbi:MAG: hypothetical protein NTZ87_02385 [Candidatus Nomurabacteria bacterium]|nr:hypothetical protein [Candidatus Nomurabacteria bacterium]
MLPEQIIYIGILINVVLSLWYIKSIIWGNTKPNLVSWSIWMLAPFAGFFLQIKAGAGISASGVFLAGFFPLLTVIVCLFRKNSYWKINSFDVLCGCLSIFTLVVYILTNNVGFSIIFAILSDALAFIPTFVKSWKFPETENSSTYIGGLTNNFLSLMILKNWTFSIYSFPLYLVLANIVEVSFVYRKKFLKSKS